MEKRTLTPLQTLRYLGESAGFFLLMGIFKALGIDAASALGGWIGRHIFIHLPPAKIARRNLHAAFPEKDEAWHRATVLEMFDNLGRVVAEYPHLDKFKLGERVEMVGAENGHAAIAKGKGVMFVAGHFANWEALHIAGQQEGYDGRIVFRAPNNPYVDRWIAKQRGYLGPTEQIEKGPRGTRQIFTALRRGQSVFLLADQKTGQGILVPFFGRDAKTTPAPATLALRMGAALVPAWCERTKGAHFRVHIFPELQFTPSGDFETDVARLTAEITQVIEANVRRKPACWLWIHRRWPEAKKQK